MSQHHRRRAVCGKTKTAGHCFALDSSSGVNFFAGHQPSFGLGLSPTGRDLQYAQNNNRRRLQSEGPSIKAISKPRRSNLVSKGGSPATIGLEIDLQQPN